MNKIKDICLTVSQWKYLLTLNEMCNTKGAAVRCKDIADILEFSKPSVHNMISTLSSMGLIEKPYYGTVSITVTGNKFIQKYLPYYLTMFNFFVNVLKLSEKDAKNGIVAFLAQISEESKVTMCKSINVKPNSLLLFHDIIAGIVTAMEARDTYTASHSMRVSDMAERICYLLNLNSKEIEIIHIAAHVHDIGKIGISDSILLKEGHLNEDEWNCMKQHPVIGYSILNKVESFEEIAKIVRHHHERFDGKGYPDGLAGKNIPLGSRIIAIADSIDAMMSNRIYRKEMSSDKCKEEIRRNINYMYDEEITTVVLDNWNKIVESHMN